MPGWPSLGRAAGRWLLAACAASACAGSIATPRDLTFEERARAQEAIERVYFAHQIGSHGSFEQAVPRAAEIEAAIRVHAGSGQGPMGMGGDEEEEGEE